MGRRLTFMLFVLVGATLGWAPLAEATPAWLVPKDISAPGLNAANEDVALDDAGEAVALWNAFDGQNEIVQTASHPPGGDWSEPLTLTAPGRSAFVNVQLAVDPQGEAVAVWESFDPLGKSLVIEAATRTAAGAWSTPTPLSAPGSNAREPVVAINPAGEAVVAWARSAGGRLVVEAASHPRGGGWTVAEPLSPTGVDAEEVQIAIDPAGDAGAVYVVTGGLVDYNLRPPGLGWRPADTIAAGSIPQVAIDPAGEAVAVWLHRQSVAVAVVESSAHPLGGQWSPPAPLSTVGGDADVPDVAIDANGGATAVWSQIANPNATVESASRAAGGAWSPARPLSPPENLLLPQIESNSSGEAVALWSQLTASGLVPEAATRSASGDWSTPIALSEPGVSQQPPHAAIDLAGEAIAIWGRPEPKNAVVQVAPFDRLGPAVTGLTIPSSGTVGVPITFGAIARDNWSASGETSWRFGDGSAAVGPRVTHTFGAPGTYRVDLAVPDALGNVSTASGTITIAAPKPAPPAAKSARAGRVVLLTAKSAVLRLSCAPPAGVACEGFAKLTARRGKKSLTLARGHFRVPGGGTATVRLKLARGRSADALLAAIPGPGMKARLSGGGLAPRAVVLRRRVSRGA